MKPGMEITVFDGGLNTEVPAENLPWNQSPALRVAVFDNYGALKSPAGYQTHNSTAFGPAGRVDGAFSFKPVTMSALLLGVNESVYVATGTATAFNLISSSQSLFTQNVDCDIVQFQDIAIFSNGGQQPYKFNGTEFTRAGISAPTQVLTAVCDAAAGNLNGTYQYVYWGVSSYSAEGDYIATPSTAVTVTTAKVRINNIPTAPASHGINTWKIGRNTANGQGVYWYLTDVTNGTTSFTDNVADSSLVVLAPTDQGYLRKFKFMAVYGNRLWGATEDDSVLWFSNLNQPEEFPSTNFIRVGRGDGLQISAIHPFKGTMVISKSDFNGKTALYQLIVGDSVTFADPENWNLVKLFDYGGSESHRACVDYSDYMILRNRDGIFAFNGLTFAGVASPTQGGTFISSTVSENIASQIRVSGYEKFMRGTAAINWKESVWFGMDLSIGLGGHSVATQNANLFIFDYARISTSSRKGGAWSRMETAFPCQQFVIHEGSLFGTTNGLVSAYFYKLDTGDMYDGGSIEQFQYYTPRMKGSKGHESLHKDFRYIYVTCSGQGSLVVDAAANGTIATVFETNTITLTSTPTRHKINLGSTKGRDIQIYFQMDFGSGDSVTITRLEVFYNLRGLRS